MFNEKALTWCIGCLSFIGFTFIFLNWINVVDWEWYIQLYPFLIAPAIVVVVSLTNMFFAAWGMLIGWALRKITNKALGSKLL